MRTAARDIAATASMASFYVILSQLPGFPVVGVDGASIGVVSSVVPVFGILAGPWIGASAAFVGGVVSRVLAGSGVFSWMVLPAMPLSAFAAGSLSRHKVGLFRGWVSTALVLGLLVLAWYSTWIGQMVFLYPILHWASLAIVLIFREWLAFFIQSGERGEVAVSVALCSFSATMAAHMYGTLAFIAVTNLSTQAEALTPASQMLFSSIFLALTPIVAVERLIITLIATILGVPIILALRRQTVKTEQSHASF